MWTHSDSTVQCTDNILYTMMVRSGNVIGHIDDVTLHRARLLLGWVTSSADKPPQYYTKPPRQTQPPTLSGTGNVYQPMCSDALWLESKGRYGSLHLWINVWMAGKTVWSLVNTCHTRVLQRCHYKALYKSMDSLLYFTVMVLSKHSAVHSLTYILQIALHFLVVVKNF